MTSVLAAVDRTAAVTIVLLLYSASSSFTLDNSTQAWRSLLFADSSFSIFFKNFILPILCNVFKIFFYLYVHCITINIVFFLYFFFLSPQIEKECHTGVRT